MAVRIRALQKVCLLSLIRLRALLGCRCTDTTIVAKQCYHCQGYGHVQADCPTLRISGAGTGGRCYTCGQPGHLAVRFCSQM